MRFQWRCLPFLYNPASLCLQKLVHHYTFRTTSMCASPSATNFPVKHHRNTFLQHSVDESDSDSPLVLVVLNTRGDSDSDELLRRLWDKAAMKVCADGGANRLHDSLNTQCVPNFIVGDLDSLRSEVAEYYQQLGAEIIHREDQDHNDFEKCLIEVKNRLSGNEIASKSKCHATVVVLSAFIGRFDHEMAAINILHSYTSQFERLVLMGGGNVAFLLLSELSHVVQADTRFEGPTVGLIPVGGACRAVTTKGFKWNLTEGCLEFGKLVSSSNHILDEVHITTDAPLLWTGEFKVNECIETLSASN